MSTEEIECISKGTRALQLSRGDILFRRGEMPNGFYVMVHGQVKLALTSPQGIEKVVELLASGQSFGEAVMFVEKPCPVYAQALGDALVLHIKREVIISAIETDPMFSRKMLAGLSIRLHRLIASVESLSLCSSAQRVIGYLLQSLEEVESGQNITITLKANKNIIASNLNITPETFSRILHNLSDKGLIEVQSREVCIRDIAKLRNHQE
jgi:CRP-like cAMP-binding protein